MLPSILEYDVEIVGNQIILSGDTNQGRFVSLVNNTTPVDPTAIGSKVEDTIDIITAYT